MTKRENEVNALFEIIKDLEREGIQTNALSWEALHDLVAPVWVHWGMGELSLGKLTRLY
jgi:hypothetical protein